MRCSTCGYEAPAGSIFCPRCGESLMPSDAADMPSGKLRIRMGSMAAADRAAAPYDAPSAPAAAPYTPSERPSAYAGYTGDSDAVFCASCGAVKPIGSSVCPSCGRSSEPPAPAYAAPKRSSRKPLVWILSAVALVALVVGLAVGISAHAGGPMQQIASAASNTLNAGSFSAYITLTEDGETEEKAFVQAKIDLQKREFTAVIKDLESGSAIAIYDGYLLQVRESRYYYDYYTDSYQPELRVYKYDISDELDQLFDAYNDSGKKINDLDIAEVLKQLDDDVYNEIKEVIDVDELNNCIEECKKRLNDEGWLAEYAGYTKTTRGGKTEYAFELTEDNIADFAGAILEIFEPAFRSRSQYRELKSELNDFDSDTDFSMRLVYIVEGKYLSSIEYEVETRYNDYEMVIEFEDFGSVSIDTDQLEDWLRQAENVR